MQTLSTTKVFDGELTRYQHHSTACQCDMVFAVYLPPKARERSVPVLYWLSGLTCTDENFMTKGHALGFAAKHGIALVAPDTSPRGLDLPFEHDSYDFGSGAGFYLNASKTPWSTHYNMYDYVVQELPSLIEANLPVNAQKSISGHSMGGHGALTIALKNSEQYRSVSAFAPICAPTKCPWGQKAFSHYLGEDQTQWQAYDSCALIEQGIAPDLPLLVDQGSADQFLKEQLKPHLLDQACQTAGQPLTLNLREGYDHSYYFIASFIEHHIDYHAQHLYK